MTAVEIGRKIKQLRIQKGLTLEELASRSELTKGFLSQLERELTSPSIATLNDIVEALGSSLAEFFKEEEQEQLVFHKKDFFVDEREMLHHQLDCAEYAEKRHGAHSDRAAAGRRFLRDGPPQRQRNSARSWRERIILRTGGKAYRP